MSGVNGAGPGSEDGGEEALPAPGFRMRPDHQIRVRSGPKEAVVMVGGRELARSTNAVILDEQGYPPRLYVPFEDVDQDALTPSETSTHCPFKGDAVYFDHGDVKDIAWAYPEPYKEMLAIAGMICFDDDKADLLAA